MFVDSDGVVGVVTTAFGTGTGTCGIVLVDINKLPAAAITNNSFTVNFSFASGLGTGVVGGTFNSGTSAAGTIDVAFAGITGCLPIHTTWTATKVDGGPIPVVAVVATDPNASEVGPVDGIFTITRAG